MDLTDGMTADEMADAAARETRRAELARGMNEAGPAKEGWRKAKDKVIAAEKDEKKRAKADKEKIEGFQKNVVRAHGWVEHTSTCRNLLFSEYVPLGLRRASDRAFSESSRAGKVLDKAKDDLGALQSTLSTREQKTVQGTKRTPSGAALRDEKGRVLIGEVQNPRRWNSREERSLFLTKIEAAELVVAEAAIKANALNKVYAKARTAVDLAFEAAVNGQ